MRDWTDDALNVLASGAPAHELETEIARLRKALQSIADCKGLYGAQAFEFQRIAQQALRPQETAGGERE